MSQELTCTRPVSARRLSGLYARALLWYLLGMALLWAVGIEGIFGHPTPFYALWMPAFAASPQLLWHLPALGVFATFFVAGATALRRTSWYDEELSRRAMAWTLVALAAFAFLFAGAVASVRGGPGALAMAYERHTYEYIGDIGRGMSIRGLFRDYLKLHPYLSMHAKVHPPGPVAVLWLVSYVAGREPMGLSLATMAIGALGIFPLYFWARELTERRVALTCCLLYAVMPSIVLFTATSADILFPPFVTTTLFLFWRAIHRRSHLCALGAGLLYGVLSLLSFSLLSFGAFFAVVGLWRLRDPSMRQTVVETAVVMVVAFLALHGAVWLWSGFDVVACFHACKAQFDADQANLDLMTPRFPGWVWRFLNPACWFYFAGIPVSVLFLWRLARPEKASKGLFVALALTAAILSLLYLGRGEGERSAMYLLPLIVLPAAHLLDRLGRQARSYAPLGVTLGFLAFQCWLTESLFFTFW